MKAYRLCRDKDGEPYTLFHGVNGSRKLSLGEWIEAEQKMVHDGSAGTPYLSGFHVMPEIPDINRLLRLFKNLDDLVIVEVKVDGETRPKAHSRHNIILAEKMLIPTEMWAQRVRVKDRSMV